MGQDFNSLNLDPFLATEVIRLCGMKHYEINIPQRYQQLRQIVTYLQKFPNPRAEVLRVISKSSGDRLDAVWTYVELRKERDERLQKLNPDDFELDIEESLKKGVLTKEHLQRAKKDIDTKKKELAKQKRLDGQEQIKKDKAVSKVFDETKLDEVQKHIYDIEDINKEIDFYG